MTHRGRVHCEYASGALLQGNLLFVRNLKEVIATTAFGCVPCVSGCFKTRCRELRQKWEESQLCPAWRREMLCTTEYLRWRLRECTTVSAWDCVFNVTLSLLVKEYTETIIYSFKVMVSRFLYTIQTCKMRSLFQ